MINFNPNTPSIQPAAAGSSGAGAQQPAQIEKFNNLVSKYMENVDQEQTKSNVAIQDFISGKSQDINSVVNEVAKADMSFKLLVGVRNKVIEAYKQTMQMQI